MSCTLDHLVITTSALSEGDAWVNATLGVGPGPGGAHEGMATHNHLLRLGESVYLEVIAPDPMAPAPIRPRWFGMDQPALLAQPRLATWVVRCSDIHAAQARLSEAVGGVHPMQRGPWSWQITIPPDGQMGLQGLVPTLIQWSDERHPTQTMPASGCELQALVLRHPEEQRVARMLASMDLQGQVPVRVASGEHPALEAHLQTPQGQVVLSGQWPLGLIPAG
jgi:hypothetical protein